MNIQRYAEEIQEMCQNGASQSDLVQKLSDIIKAQHERDMRFAKWYGSTRYDAGNQHGPFPCDEIVLEFYSVQEAYEFWKKNIDK